MLLATQGLRKRYVRGGVAVDALVDATLAVPEGSFTTLTGPSGSGKSTLLMLVAGLLTPSGGRILWRGQPLEAQDDAAWALFRRRQLGFVMQAFSLVPYLTALDNVALPLAVDGVAAAERRARAALLLDRVGLAGRAEHLPRELSAGQQQRVAIARALAGKPALVLADEPTGNLDPALARDVLALLTALNREDGLTLLMVTHSPEAAAAGTQRIQLEAGRVVPVPPPAGAPG
ncbi:MAG: ABC transporter ATP-binding protein [Planctomycetia bacterium]